MPSRQPHGRRAQRSKPDDLSYPSRGAVKKHTRKPGKKTTPRATGPIQAESTQPKLSALEQLPTEILQEIFLLSPNLNLPLASPFLGKALSSDYLKTELVIQAFSSSMQILTQERPLPIRMSRFSFIPGYSQEPISSVAFCQNLLPQRWLTYDFFKRCQRTYLLRVAESQLRKLGKASPGSDSTEALTTLRRNFDRYLSVGGFALSKANEAHYGKPGLVPGDGSYVWKLSGSTSIGFALLGNGSTLRIDVIKSGQWPSSVCRNVEQDKLYKDFGSLWYNGMSSQEVCSLTQFPGRLSECYIPEKLLHGPWLQEKGDFLTILLTNRVRMAYSLRSTIGEVASKGLEDAIRENNVLAVSCLLGVGSCAASGVCSHGPGDECSRTLVEQDAIKHKTAEDGVYLTNDGVSIFVPKPPDPRGPWRKLNCPNTALPHFNMVKPNTDHLKIALIEMDGCNEFIVKALMGHFTHHPRIDYHDQEVMQWAFANLNRPTPQQKHSSLVYPTWEKPVSGAMFMDLLDEAQNQQTTREKKNKRRRDGVAERRAEWEAMSPYLSII